MTDVEQQPPQNGIDPNIGEEDDNNKARPADIEQDMREMERRKRVEAIMGSRLFREELERIVDSAREGGAGASGILQQLSDIVGVPVQRVGNVFKSSSCMVPINDIRGVESMGYAKGEKILRCKLAATFRLLDLYGWTQGLGAQITARLKVDQEYFLVNPYGLLYHEITASALNKVDMQGQIVEQGTTNFGVNKSHFVLHSVLHAARPDIRCAIYIGCSPVVAISSLKSGLLPLTKDACVLGEITTHAYTGLFDSEERDRLVRSLGPNSKVMLLANHGALCCGETIEEAFFAACHIVQACETQLKLLPVGLDNLVLIPEEARKLIFEQSRRPPEDLAKKFAAVTVAAEAGAEVAKEEPVAPPKVGSPPKWRVGGAEFEALMRMLDNAGYRTGYIYRHPLIKSDPPKPKNDVELPPAVSSLGYLLEEEELFRQGIWKKGDIRKGGDRSRWLNSPNVYQKVEVLETGTPDPKKITKWVAEGSPTHSTPIRIEDPLQFVPGGTTTKEFKRIQQQIKDNRRADKISAGPQSHILEGVTWDEANRIKDATVSQAGDHVVLMGAASKGIIQRGFQHNATVYKAPYAKNPFDNVTDDELNEYKRTVERKKKSIHGEYTDTDFSESEALNSMQAAAIQHTKHAQSEPETEHQVIQIQTQQAPMPSQAEVVLSDATLSFINGERSHSSTNRKPPTGRVEQVQSSSSVEQVDVTIVGDKSDNYDADKENREKSSSSKCRRDLFCSSPSTNINPPQSDLAHIVENQSLIAPALVQEADLYYGYGAVPSHRCRQPQLCSNLLKKLQQPSSPSQCHSLTCFQSCGQSTAPSTTTTGSSTPPSQTLHRRRPLQQPQAGNLPPVPPYRTHSHFGFQSPRQPPRAEHKHLPRPLAATVECIKYRPMRRAVSYEEIFATPRYEQLCHFCFEQLLRLKPQVGQHRRNGSSSSCTEADVEELASSLDTAGTAALLPTLPELEDEYDELLLLAETRRSRHVSTQTTGVAAAAVSTSVSNFLTQIERLNFSEESANGSYEPGLKAITSDISLPGIETSVSAAASATSVPPLRALLPNEAATITGITEIWHFGDWQQQNEEQPLGKNEEEEFRQEPLTERRITLEITQHFAAEEDQERSAARQLMSRDERQRRKSEFQELWQDHVHYFGDREVRELEEEEQLIQPSAEQPLQMSLEAQEARALMSYGWLKTTVSDEEEEPQLPELAMAEVESPHPFNADARDKAQRLVVEELPRIMQQFEQSLSAAGENLVKLMATTRKLQTLKLVEEQLDDVCDYMTASEAANGYIFSSSSSEEEQVVGQHSDHEEKQDVEKPVTPLPENIEEKDQLELNEKQMDEQKGAEKKAAIDEERNEMIIEEDKKNEIGATEFSWANQQDKKEEESDEELNEMIIEETVNKDSSESNENQVEDQQDEKQEKNDEDPKEKIIEVGEEETVDETSNEESSESNENQVEDQQDEKQDENDEDPKEKIIEEETVDETSNEESSELNEYEEEEQQDAKKEENDEEPHEKINDDDKETVEETLQENELEILTDSPDFFSPLEREILERIEANKLKESEEIFGKIDHSIRNKLTPSKLQRIVGEAEETFKTCTHIYNTTSTPNQNKSAILFEFGKNNDNDNNNEPSCSNHNTSAPCRSSNYAATPRLSRSLSNQDQTRECSSSLGLERSISSMTFVCRRKAPSKASGKPRNFILENIRNASKPRCSSKTSTSTEQSLKKNSSNDSSVCSFQANQQSSGATRLWVSIPSPRNRKRNSVSPNRTIYSSPRTPSSPYAKRHRAASSGGHKPKRRHSLIPAKLAYATASNQSLNYSLQTTLSSRTFIVPSPVIPTSLLERVSTTTFELEYTEEEECAAAPSPSSLFIFTSSPTSPTEPINATNSSMYYSADENHSSGSTGEMTEENENAEDAGQPIEPASNDESVESSGGDSSRETVQDNSEQVDQVNSTQVDSMLDSEADKDNSTESEENIEKTTDSDESGKEIDDKTEVLEILDAEKEISTETKENVEKTSDSEESAKELDDHKKVVDAEKDNPTEGSSSSHNEESNYESAKETSSEEIISDGDNRALQAESEATAIDMRSSGGEQDSSEPDEKLETNETNTDEARGSSDNENQTFASPTISSSDAEIGAEENAEVSSDTDAVLENSGSLTSSADPEALIHFANEPEIKDSTTEETAAIIEKRVEDTSSDAEEPKESSGELSSTDDKQSKEKSTNELEETTDQTSTTVMGEAESLDQPIDIYLNLNFVPSYDLNEAGERPREAAGVVSPVPNIKSDDNIEVVDEEEEQDSDAELYSSGVSLEPSRAATNLVCVPRLRSIDDANLSSSGSEPGEALIKVTQHSPPSLSDQTESSLQRVADAKPSGSAAASKASANQKNRKPGGAEKIDSEEEEEEDVIVLHTQCNLRGETLHISDDSMEEEEEEIQEPSQDLSSTADIDESMMDALSLESSKMNRKQGGAEKAGSEEEEEEEKLEEDEIVLNTQCNLRGETLHISDESLEPLDVEEEEIQAPRNNPNLDRNNNNCSLEPNNNISMDLDVDFPEMDDIGNFPLLYIDDMFIAEPEINPHMANDENDLLNMSLALPPIQPNWSAEDFMQLDANLNHLEQIVINDEEESRMNRGLGFSFGTNADNGAAAAQKRQSNLVEEQPPKKLTKFD